MSAPPRPTSSAVRTCWNQTIPNGGRRYTRLAFTTLGPSSCRRQRKRGATPLAAGSTIPSPLCRGIRESCRGKTARFKKGSPVSQLIAIKSSYGEIDERSLNLFLPLNNIHNIYVNSGVDMYLEGFSSISGSYQVDSSRSVIRFARFDDQIAAGSFTLYFFKPNTTDTLRLTDGRFDLGVSTF